jgi:alpha-glucosidase (family GH31 glycosyl hydrolase)
MRRSATVLFAAVLIGLPHSSIADPGNLVSWFSNSLNEITFTCQTAVVKLEMLDTGVARVRLSTNNVSFSTNVSFTVVRNWPLPAMSVTDGNPLIVSNAGLRVEVSKTPFRLTFKKPDGTELLNEINSFGLDYRGATNYANFFMPASEEFYGLGMSFFKPLSYRNQTRTLFNARVQTSPGGPAVTDMAVPLLVSSKGYGLLVDNTFPQFWDFTVASATRWLVRTDGGELNYYFFAGDSLADVLNRYTQATGRAPVPPRWTFGYTQARNGYNNWSDVYSAKDGFRTNDLPCDALFLDFQWFGNPCTMGALTWNSGAFPNPAQNIATLGSNGFKTVLIHEPYVNNAQANYNEGASLKYLMTDNYPARDIPSTVNGFFCTAGYVDFNNPAARSWWFDKLKPRINEGNAAQWVDLGEPEYDGSTTLTDYSYDGRRESELHNVYSLLWHQALAEGYATNYPNQRLWIYSRSGFAGDQRYGAAHWSNDVGTDWNTFAAHLNAMNDFSLSGMSYYGSDIGGYWPTNIPNDELYLRWFQYGAFSPVFRGHGLSDPGGIGYKAVAPYDFTNAYVREICRVDMKLRYRLLPYIYTAARETFDAGTPMCRPLPLAFPGDANALNNGTQFMFGPNIMVAPITTEGLTSRSVYLPSGKWIDHWTGSVLTGPVTTNWPAPLTQIPLFYRDNTITPLGPYVASTQFDDGSQRAVRIYCGSSASCTLYDDDGASNGYRSNQFATTSISASKSGNIVFMQMGGASGSYSNQPNQRAWSIELYCTNAVFNVVGDGGALTNLPSLAALTAAPSGYYLDGAEKLLRVKLPAASIIQSHSVYAYLDLSAPAPSETRIKAVDRPYLDTNGALWVQDRAYSAGSFGYSGGTTFSSANLIDGTDDDILFQSERYGSPFSYLFDVPNGRYEVQLLDAETANNNPGDRLINVFIEGQQVLTNFDILAAAGGKNKALTLTFTNTVADGQLAITFSGVSGHTDPNARVSAISVRKIADADSDGDGMPDWWEDAFGLNKNSSTDASADADGDGVSNLNEFLARTNPRDAASALTVTTIQNESGGFQISWPSVAGKKYRVQFSDDLQTWTPIVPDFLANSSMATWTDSVPLPQRRFYRVQALP